MPCRERGKSLDRGMWVAFVMGAGPGGGPLHQRTRLDRKRTAGLAWSGPCSPPVVGPPSQPRSQSPLREASGLGSGCPDVGCGVPVSPLPPVCPAEEKGRGSVGTSTAEGDGWLWPFLGGQAGCRDARPGRGPCQEGRCEGAAPWLLGALTGTAAAPPRSPSKARPSRRVSDLGVRSPRAPSWAGVGRTAGAEGVCRGRCSRFARSSGNVPFPHPQVFLVTSFTSHVHRRKPIFSGLCRV